MVTRQELTVGAFLAPAVQLLAPLEDCVHDLVSSSFTLPRSTIRRPIKLCPQDTTLDPELLGHSQTHRSSRLPSWSLGVSKRNETQPSMDPAGMADVRSVQLGRHIGGARGGKRRSDGWVFKGPRTT